MQSHSSDPPTLLTDPSFRTPPSNIANDNAHYKISEVAELERLMGQLTYQNMLKDRQMERLNWDQTY